jgi:hypothetical protein
MKSSSLIALAAGLAGFAGGWLLKPSAAPAPPVAVAAGDESAGHPAPAAGKSRPRDERPLVLKPRGRAGDEGEMKADPEQVAAEVAFERGFQSATARTEKARLQRLSEALGLSPEQEATMAVLLENRRDGFRELSGGGSSPAAIVEQAARAERSFQEQAAKLLDPEQIGALAALREREKENDIESRAQRDLADLIGRIDLSPDQREQALAALRDDSAAAVAKRPEGWAVMNETLDVLGGAHSSAFEQMGDFMDDPGALADPQEIHRRLIQAQREAAERKLAGLAAILTPGQLAQYRATLEARAGFREQFSPPTPR